jgi:hypothetical protein
LAPVAQVRQTLVITETTQYFQPLLQQQAAVAVEKILLETLVAQVAVEPITAAQVAQHLRVVKVMPVELSQVELIVVPVAVAQAQ